MKTIFILLITVVFQSAFAKDDFIVREFCGRDSRLFKNYCLELVEFKYQSKLPMNGRILLIPGFFQNYHIWHLVPHKGISVAKFLMEKHGLQPYVLHVRGIGKSDYVKDSNLDDIAIDDIPRAVNELNKLNEGPVYVMGHSQGAITALASLSGLSRCGQKNCFKKDVALKRQQQVKKLALLAGNQAMSIDRKDNFLLPLVKLNVGALRSTLRFIDEIDVKIVTNLTGPVAFINYWNNLYLIENVPEESRKALWKNSVDTTTAEIVIQFAEGVENRNIKAAGGDNYTDGAKNVEIPVVQQTFDSDDLAEWELTKKDTFEKIGSKEKEFLVVNKRAHEDFFMNKDLHSDLDPVINFILQQ